MSDMASYVHRRGIHCESACQANLLAAGGREIAEEDIFGLDGSFGFSFFATKDNSPDIVVGKQEIMPLRASRLLGVQVRSASPTSSAALSKLLDHAPAVIARVDIGLLPHWGLKGRSSFGGYFVNVVRAVDDGFEISDAAFDEPFHIAAADLDAARASRATPPLNPNHIVYLFASQQNEPRLELVGPVAVRNLCRSVLKPGNRSLGIWGLKSLQAAARAWPNTKTGQVEDVDLTGNVTVISALGRQLLHVGRQIESFGTGGGLFRPLLGRFLVRVGEATGNEAYREAAAGFAAVGNAWRALGVDLLARGGSEVHSELVDLVDSVVDTARQAMEQENDILSKLVSL